MKPTTIFAICCATALFLAGAALEASAQTAGSNALIDQLTCRDGQDCAPKPPGRVTRGLSKTRSFQFETATEQGRQDVEERAKTGRLPTADLEINFEFNSDVVGAPARVKLTDLGIALSSPQLKESRIVLIGHTDGKGSDAYNQQLSERRAAAVKQFLVATFGIDPRRLDTYGRGRSLPKNAADPLAAENRRVQIVNGGQVEASGSR